LRRVLEGQHPLTAEPLGRHAATRVPGFDVTFSAPKSVSVLFGIGDDAMRATIRRAHETAVRDAFGYLERQAAVARRGPAGRISVRGHGFVAAAFRHRTSRAGDPQLHTHVLVANLVHADDGRWSALDSRRLYAHAKTAGYLYEASLRAELTRHLGVAWTPVRNGIADVAGMPQHVLRAFSRRREQIEQELARRGQSGPRAAQAATLQTRRRKGHDVDPVELNGQWRERAAELGFTRAHARELCGRAGPTLDATVLSRVHLELAGRHGLTRTRSSFTRRDVLQAWSERLPAGASVDVALLERIADHFLATDAVVPLAVGQPVRVRDEVLQRHDGRLVRALPDERRYTTLELLSQEERLVRRALRDRGAGLGLAPPVRCSPASRRRWCGGSRAMATAWRSSSDPRARARPSRLLRPERRGS
jgi:conjugative relaxase-like TrwC/TraI family protein